MKGIILAGGYGTKLYPITKVISKQLLPIYNKPMIYYPLSLLMTAGIRDILIISTPKDLPLFKELLGDGSQIGMNFTYTLQQCPNGLAEAFLLGETFIGKDTVGLALGDNLFHGKGLEDTLIESMSLKRGATIFGYSVDQPNQYGVVELDYNGRPVSLEEKPEVPKSSYAVPGLYFYDNDVIEIAKKIKPSVRGELEITSINHEYLINGQLEVKLLDNNITWLDTGTYERLLEASNFVKEVEEKTSQCVGCIELIAYNKGYIGKNQLFRLIKSYEGISYGNYIMNKIK